MATATKKEKKHQRTREKERRMEKNIFMDWPVQYGVYEDCEGGTNDFGYSITLLIMLSIK